MQHMNTVKSSSETPKPQWCRPKYVQEVYSVKPGNLSTLIKSGAVTSVKVGNGQKKGVRLIEVASLEKFLARLSAEQRPASQAAGIDTPQSAPAAQRPDSAQTAKT
jgi:ribosomal protein L23